MKTLLTIALIIVSIGNGFSQEPEFYQVKKNTGKVVITPHYNSDIVIYRISGLFRNARKIIYHDTINGYKAQIEPTVEIQETNSLFNLCFTIPREEGPDNAICINSAEIVNYDGLKGFKRHIIEDPKYLGENGKSWIWGDKSKLVSIHKERFNKHESYKVEIEMNNKPLLGQFLFWETKKSFLWINFVADVDTFDEDLKLFSKFVKKLKLL